MGVDAPRRRMIEYETLCQQISDWREGKKPAGPPPMGGVAAAPHADEPLEHEPNLGAVYDDAEPLAVDDAEVSLGEYGDDVVELQPDADLHHDDGVDIAEAASTHAGLLVPDEELDTTLEDSNALDEFAESPVDRTAAYIPEDYDPAGVAAQVPAAPAPDPAASLDELDIDDVDVAMADDVTEMDVDDVIEEDADDFERDYELEEIDDFASFDPYSDLKAFFKAEAEITAVWEDDASRRAALTRHGIRDEQHFYQVTSSMERYFISEDAEARYGGLDGIMQLKMDASHEVVREEQQARIEGELASDFEPVHGISLQQWAQAQAQIAQGADAAQVVVSLGIDEPTWQAVSAEWNNRMSQDTTATIATEYGKAFAGAGTGQFGDAGQAAAEAMETGGDPVGDPPIAIEQWVEIEVAQSVGYEQGRDAAEILASFGMTPADWGIASSWWSQYFARHAMENGGALQQHYSQLRDHYEAHYRGQ